MNLLNQCRVYLQVTTLLDITSGDGCYVLPHVFMRHNPLQAYSHIQWPRQGYPSEKAWLLWTIALRRCFPNERNGRLIETLGKWIHVDPTWGAFFDHQISLLYVKGERWMWFTPNTQVFTGHNEQYILRDYSEPSPNYSHVAVAWIDHNEQLQSHGISRK